MFAVAFALIAVSCTDTDESAGRALAPRVTTTAAPSLDADGAELPPPLPGASPRQIRQDFSEAVEARDFCLFATALDNGIPDVADRSAVIEAYEALAEGLVSARSFRPAELDEPWERIIDGATDGLEAIRGARGDLSDPGVASMFTSDAMQSAVRAVERWTATGCSSPSTPGGAPPSTPGSTAAPAS